MGTGPHWSAVANLSGNPSNGIQWNGGVGHSQDDDGGHGWDGGGGLSFRPTPRWRLQADGYLAHSTDTRQYVTALPGGGPETYGTRYVFGTIERSDVSVQLRLGYTLKPDLTLDVYAEPFAASGRYLAFGELAAARSRELRVYGAGGTSIEPQADGSRQVRDAAAVFALPNRDFHVKSWRSNVVLRWEWRLGSTAYLIWQQDRFASETSPRRAGFRELLDTISAPGDNVLAVKVTFWLPVR
jgi:hypothetical protein